jgi:hypothetical protein
MDDLTQLEDILVKIEDAIAESELDEETKDNIYQVVDGIRVEPTPANMSVLVDLLQALSYIEVDSSIDALKALMQE